jgi:hypothetical protein
MLQSIIYALRSWNGTKTAATGSNGKMSRPSQVRRRFGYFVLAVMAVLVIVVGTLRIQQWVLRHRAERLLAEIQQIELRKTSFEDAQNLFGRWSKWGHYKGECTRQHCQFLIRLTDFLGDHPRLFNRSSVKVLYSAIGGRPTIVYAGVSVIDGVIWEKRYGFDSAPRGIVSGEANTLSWLPASDDRFALHPNHTVVPYRLEPCVWIVANFTPFEDPAEVRRLMGFDLSVITHWSLSYEKNDVMHAACTEARQEQHLVVLPTAHGQPDSPRHESLEYLARDAGRVAVVKIISKPSQSGDPWAPWRLETKLEEPLKRYSPWDVGTVQELHLHCSDVNWVPDVQVGQRYLILTDWAPDSTTITCGGIEPATEENLAVTRRGIAQDYKAAFGEPER